MLHDFRCALLVTLLTLSGFVPVRAQETPAVTSRYEDERARVVSTLETLLADLDELASDPALGDLAPRLRTLRHRLTEATVPLGAEAGPASPGQGDDLRRLERLLAEVHEQFHDLRIDLEDREEFARADRLLPLERRLREALITVRRLLPPPEDVAEHEAPEADERDHPAWHERRRRPTAFRHRYDRERRAAAFLVGEVWNQWPIPTTGLYRPITPLRYNRVEGLVLGIGQGPLAWDSYRRARLYGQVGYAFGLERIRYEAGLEMRLGPRYGRQDFDLKLGGAYRRQTATNDLWKTDWVENSLAAFFFANDFFDYYETEGWSVYGLAHVTPYLQLGAGFRSEEHRTLARTTTWALFGSNGLDRPNRPAREGRMHTLVLTLEGGRIRDVGDHPRGAGFRLEAELGDGLGGDFAFNRYTGDLRLYLLPTPELGLNLRLLGGLTTGEAPPQKAFTLGGVGSVRAYPQNLFAGTRALLANLELAFYEGSPLDDLVWDDLHVFGLFDAGWVNRTGTDRFDLDDVIPAAGFGLGLDDRRVRLELVWPLRDLGTGTDPTLWLRIAPAF